MMDFKLSESVFISGWAGFKELFPTLKNKIEIFVPFMDFMPDETVKSFDNKKGNILIGWSTGSQIILDNLTFFYDRFDKILLFAPFDKFTRFHDKRILRLMRKKLKINPYKVICDFMVKAGVQDLNLIPANDLQPEKLYVGLKYLERCEITSTVNESFPNLFFIQGIYDKIVSCDYVDILSKKFKKSKVIKIKQPHFFDEDTIEEYYEIIR